MKEINYLHVSGLAVVSLIIASVAQHVLKDPTGSGPPVVTRTSTLTVDQSQSEAARVTEEAESRRISAIRDRGHQEHLSRHVQRKAEQSKEQAWAKYYTPPSACHNPDTSVMFNACADEHIRARNRFEAEYKNPGQAIEPFQSSIASNE